MKNILIILLLVTSATSFGQTKLIAKLTRNSPTDTTYGLLNDSLIIGGHMTLSSIANRDAIPFSNRTRGMFAVVNDTVFILKGGIGNSNWQVFTTDTSNFVVKSNTISINGVTKTLGSNPSFSVSGGSGGSIYAGAYLTKPNDSTLAVNRTALDTVYTKRTDKVNADSLNRQLASYYLIRTNQTGTQPVTTITGISGNSPINYSGGVISADTGRGSTQLVTGAALIKVRDSVQANIPTNYLTNNTTETVTAEKTFAKNKLAVYNPTLGTQLFLNAADNTTQSTVNFPTSANDTVAYRGWVRQTGGGGGSDTVSAAKKNYYRLAQLSDSSIAIISYDSTRRDTLVFGSGNGNGTAYATTTGSNINQPIFRTALGLNSAAYRYANQDLQSSNDVNFASIRLNNGNNGVIYFGNTYKLLYSSATVPNSELIYRYNGTGTAADSAYDFPVLTGKNFINYTPTLNGSNIPVANRSTFGINLGLKSNAYTTVDSTTITNTGGVLRVVGGGGGVSSGTYTPTLTNSLNIYSSSNTNAYYTRIGNIVHVAVSIIIQPTSSGGTTQLTLSLPITSSFSTGGAGNIIGSTATNPTGFTILASTTQMVATFASTDTTSRGYFIQFDYSL